MTPMSKDPLEGLSECALCEERKYANTPVPGVGNRNLALICFLGRNPGRNEDLREEPFVGKAGTKLNAGMIVANILRNEVYITNLSKCMTPTNINPSPVCRRKCASTWLNNELASLERLRLVVTLGNEALQYFEPLGRVGELQGTSFITTCPWSVGGATGLNVSNVLLFVSYHPSAACRSSAFNEKFMEGMRRLGRLVASDYKYWE